MDNLEDTENHAKISDSAYSNSYSNSQSRSHSSKSTHSGSNSSGSSGYGGKPSTLDGSTSRDQPPEKRSKDIKKKKQTQQLDNTAEAEVVQEKADAELKLQLAPPQPEKIKDTETAAVAQKENENGAEKIETAVPEWKTQEDTSKVESTTLCPANPIGKPNTSYSCNGFSCVISMHDGVVIYTTSSLTTSLGFPKHMWIGRSFIDFIHPSDRNTFASQITNGLSLPKTVNGMKEKVTPPPSSVSTTVCRIRRYRGLSTGFNVKDSMVVYLPFLLKLSFKNITDEEGKVVYLVIQATQFVSAFKTPNEILTNPTPFVMRHSSNGSVEYVDPESVPYLGYLPQDLVDKDALQLYHPQDLTYLMHVYETIVKEGGVPCSKPYRLLAHNGDYVKVETEWSSFINPWSRKLEFVIGKHHIIEGPSNPDVFHVQFGEKLMKMSTDDKCKANSLREFIVRIMNEPAEVAKQHTTKRCHDLASFMENLIEQEPKNEEELRVDIQEPDNSYYERDSVMLGGISPHHDFNDSKSSSETPLSYNQLNYNENLQRYFDSHQPYSYEDYNTVSGENILDFSPKTNREPCLSPMAQYSGDSYDMMSNSDSSGPARLRSSVDKTDYHPIRLTESLLTKHNSEMEKKLVKMHRENRSSSKGEREKVSMENRQKKKEHLARCNSTLRPEPVTSRAHAHGVKRSSKPELMSSHKHHCGSPPTSHRRHAGNSSMLALPPNNCAYGESYFAPNPVNNMNTFFVGVGIPQQMSFMSSIAAVPGMFPLYYAPNPEVVASSSETNTSYNNNYQSNSNDQVTQKMPYMMYGQSMYGSPLVYSPIYQQRSYPLQDNLMRQTLQLSNSTFSMSTKTSRDHTHPAMNVQSQRTVAVTQRLGSRGGSTGNKSKSRQDDRTDGESSYSSFYSSFFKTDSGSAEESGDSKKNINTSKSNNSSYTPNSSKKVPKRKMEPPWLEQVCVTSELIYKYQIYTKSLEEVLEADKKKMSALEQPALVNEQLDQLYMDLQLEGVAARLTLEEGITSSSSSGEESSVSTKVSRRKREYSKLVFIYEEESPLPPPPDGSEYLTPEPSLEEPRASTSTELQ